MLLRSRVVQLVSHTNQQGLIAHPLKATHYVHTVGMCGVIGNVPDQECSSLTVLKY